MWRYILIKILHLKDMFRILDNAFPEGLHNIIVDIFNVVLKYVPVLPPHALFRL